MQLRSFLMENEDQLIVVNTDGGYIVNIVGADGLEM